MENIDLPSWLLVVLAIVGIVDLLLKGFALWRAAQKQQLGWFIALLILNTAGILPLLYLYTFSEKGK